MSIRIESLTKKFGEHTLFDNLSIDIPLGKTTIISGSSGGGKTTLLRIIAGLDSYFSGSVSGVPESISIMFQEDRLLPWYSVKQNLEFVLKDVMEKPQIDAAVKQIIDAVKLGGHEEKRPSKLSGGMNRRVCLARAFVYPADLLLMDEPFKGLDTKLKLEMITLFKSLYMSKNKTAILVTHDDYVIENLGCDVMNLDELVKG